VRTSAFEGSPPPCTKQVGTGISWLRTSFYGQALSLL